MLARNLRQLFLSCERNIRTIRGGRKFEDISDPGLSKRLRAFKEKGIKIEDEDAEEFIEDSNSDLFHAGVSYTDHIKETLIGKHVLRHQIVKDKYFKENTPNLLTWSEKEQIRHLASTDPEEWTPEKIAESFPVTPHIVKKLLKYPWKPASEERIARHDASAMRNWKQLKDGTLDIPDDLRERFLQFSNRTIPPLRKESIKIDLTKNEENVGEFESIVRRCAANEAKSSQNNHDRVVNDDEKANVHSEVKKRDKKLTTLDELATKIQKQLDKGEDIAISDKLLVHTMKTDSAMCAENSNVDLEPFSSPKNEISVSKQPDHKPTTYPERIRIPKSAYKKGATYKVKDCFYDDDGRFLYRVLGMSD